MSVKDNKDVKTLEKLKQFFRINKGNPGTIKTKEDFFLTIELEKDLSSDSPLSTRIKTVKELIETVQNNKLEENAPAKFWCLLKDLLSTEVSLEHRHLVFSFFRALIHGQYERLGMMRAQFFRLIKSHKVPEDVIPRLELLQSLTDTGKDILYMEDSVGGFLLEWMPDIVKVGKELGFLCILITCIKYNAAYFEEDIIAGIVQSTCVLCCQSKDEQVVLHCLELLDTTVCYTNLPSESLPPFIATLCRTVNIELYCPTSWKIMRNLLGTHLGHTSLYIMCDILMCEASLNDPGLLRGAVFYINMALWGNKKIINTINTPSAVLEAFLSAMKCEHTIVMFEVMLGIQRLVNKQGPELLHPTWCSLLEVIKKIISHIEKNGPSAWIDQVSTHLHETLNKIELLIEEDNFNGNAQMVFDIIEKCSNTRPETSVQRLIVYIAKTVVPTRSRWLEKLNNLMVRFYEQDERPSIRKKALGILSNCIQTYRYMYESELTKITLEHLSDISNEPNLSIRVSATQILVDLFIYSEPSRALDAAEVLEKIINRPFLKEEKISAEEDAEDIKIAAHGLINGFSMAMFQSPPTCALKAYELITNHLEAHYNKPHLLSQISSIRHLMIECLLKIRGDSYGRIGMIGLNKKYSIFLKVANIDKPAEIPPNSEDAVHYLNITPAIEVILIALRYETDWLVLLKLLQGLPEMLKSRTLFIHGVSSFDIDRIASTAISMVTEPLNLPDKLTNKPPKFTKSDFNGHVFPVVTALIPYHCQLESSMQQKIIKTLEIGLAVRSASPCVFALTLCVLEMQDAMVKLLPEVLLNLSKISATVPIAIPILEFLSTLTQLPKVFANFVDDQYMSVFAISLPYTNPFKFNYYTVSLAHHIIAAWFLKCRLPFRKGFVKFILNGLKTNLFLFEDLQGTRSGELINEDSSNRKRSSSLTEQGSRKRETRSSVSSRVDFKRPMDDSLVIFHKELTETCLDLMSMYTFATCCPVPRRNTSTEKILNGGQSMTWLVGNKLITVTTSGCTMKALKHGFCDRCYQECRVRPDPAHLIQEDDSAHGSKSTEGAAGPSSTVLPEKDKNPAGPEKLKLPGTGTPQYRTERQICPCWCKSWAEILIKRPAGAVSWTMRLSNELHPLQCPKDFTNSEISTYTLPPLTTQVFEDKVSSSNDDISSELDDNSNENWDEMDPLEQDEASDMVSLRNERVASEPVCIPCSPIRKNVGHEFDEFGPIVDEGSGRSRNPVRRSNSSPEMSCSWKNPLLAPDEFEFESKKKQYTKEMRGNWEAIPEEMGTTPPTSEALMLAPCDNTDAKSSRPPRECDPSGLPPLGYKRDRGHTISVMSPARKPGTLTWSDSRPRSPKPRENAPVRSGVNPAFVFLQLYHSPYFGTSLEKPILVSNLPAVQNAIKLLDWIPPYEVHKIGVLYVGPGQANCEADILRNEFGSPRYVQFLERLGNLINLAEADKQQYFLGGLNTSGDDGKFAYIWQDDVMQVIFHVATLMPNNANDPMGHDKKKHIGNNFVTIVYNDSGEEYNFQTVKTQFNYAVVIVEPLDLGTNQVIVKAKEELHQQICLTDYKVVSDESAPILARQLAVHSNLASTISRKNAELYASNWLERLRLIKRIRAKLQQGIADEKAQSKLPSRRLLIEDFTEYT